MEQASKMLRSMRIPADWLTYTSDGWDNGWEARKNPDIFISTILSED